MTNEARIVAIKTCKTTGELYTIWFRNDFHPTYGTMDVSEAAVFSLDAAHNMVRILNKSDSKFAWGVEVILPVVKEAV